MKPPIPYYGGKQMLADRIVSLFPAHEHYVEPYAGSLAVLLAKPPSKLETVNDLDGALMTFWRVLRGREAELQRAVNLTPHSRAEHAAALNLDGCDELEVARRVWVQLTQGRMARRAATGWCYKVTADKGATVLDAYRDRLPAAAVRLRSVQLECRPAVDVIDAFGRNPKALLYVDPPYVTSTRGGTNYRHEMSDDDHRELAEALQACKATVVLSGYPSPLYDELYAGWHRTSIAASTGQGGTWEGRTEVLWSNVPLGVQGDLFDMAGVA